MCFSYTWSAVAGVSSLFAGLSLIARKEHPRKYTICLFFSAMEFLQMWQYTVEGQCDNPLNQALTLLAMIHVAFQPLVVNYYFLAGQANPGPQVTNFVLKLCLAGAALNLLRLPGSPLGRLGDLVHTWVPDIPPSSSMGQHCSHQEAFCAPQLCSFKGGAWGHISWSSPMLPATYFLPHSAWHFMLFFLPVLIAGDAAKRALMTFVIGVGPVFGMVMASRDMSTYRFEWATIWCFFAAVQGTIAVILEATIMAKSFAPYVSPASSSKGGGGKGVVIAADARAQSPVRRSLKQA